MSVSDEFLCNEVFRCTKLVHIAAVHDLPDAEAIARLILVNVVCHHGMPRDVVSDRVMCESKHFAKLAS